MSDNSCMVLIFYIRSGDYILIHQMIHDNNKKLAAFEAELKHLAPQ